MAQKKGSSTVFEKFRDVSIRPKLMLLCESSGNIGTFSIDLVFAEGESNIMNRTIADLMGRNFFSLGFTQRSLKKLAKYASDGLIQPPFSKR